MTESQCYSCFNFDEGTPSTRYEPGTPSGCACEGEPISPEDWDLYVNNKSTCPHYREKHPRCAICHQKIYKIDEQLPVGTHFIHDPEKCEGVCERTIKYQQKVDVTATIRVEEAISALDKLFPTCNLSNVEIDSLLKLGKLCVHVQKKVLQVLKGVSL